MKEGILFLNEGSEASQVKQKQYKEMTGLLMFLIVETRLDIAFAISVINRLIKNPLWQYIKVVKTILLYLKTIKIVDIIHSGDERRDLTLFRLRLGWRLCHKKVNLQLYFHIKWGHNQLEFKKSSDGGLVIYRSEICDTNSSYKKSHLEEVIANIDRAIRQWWFVYYNQSYQKSRDIVNQSQDYKAKGGSYKYLVLHCIFDNKYSFNNSYFYLSQRQ